MTQTELLALFRSDKERGLEAIVSAYAALVGKTVRLTGGSALSPEDAEEIISDVFLAFYRSAEGFDEEKGRLSTFLITLARRKTVDRLRRRERFETQPLEEAATLLSPENVEETVLREEERERLTSALVALGEPDATILFRRYYLEESWAQIGRRVGLSENAVNQRALRAQKKLLAGMKGEDRNDG